MLAGVPLDQFAYSGPARPPLVDLLDALPADTPQLAFDHPRPHRLASRMNAVFAGQVFRRQCRAEAAIHLAAQNLQRRLLDLFVQFAVGPLASQSMHQSSVAFALEPPQQPPNMPLALPDLLGGLPLRDQPLLGFLQCDQPVAVSLRHEKCS
jgi:hypothetical protein